MNVLIIGQSAREHALACKLARSPIVKRVFVSPGNAAMQCMDNLEVVGQLDFRELSEFVSSKAITRAIVGPTIPMTLGVVDRLAELGVKVIGANRAAAKLESSKCFSKRFMDAHAIPTPNFKEINSIGELNAAVSNITFPVVIKSDSLILSHLGVVIADSLADARVACTAIFDMQTKRGYSPKILVEEFVKGPEISFTIWMDKFTWALMPTCRDYKKLYEGDFGINTHGMGAYAPVPWVTKRLQDRIVNEIVKPTFDGLQSESLVYCGPLYLGIIIDETDGNPKLLEYNVRLGDPEGQTILSLLESDLGELIDKSACDRLSHFEFRWSGEYAVSTYAVSPGYPENSGSVRFSWLPDNEGCLFGGSVEGDEDGSWVGNGRTLCSTDKGPTLAMANERSNSRLSALDVHSRFIRRRDVGILA